MVKKGVCSSVTKNLRESRKITGKQTACLDHTDRCALLCVDRACVCPQIVEGQSHKNDFNI